MKKLFTLVALLTVFMGANAANWNKVKEINFSDYTGFPHYVMGYVPEWVDGVMTDYGANYRYETQENLDGDGDGKLKDGESVVGSTTTNGGAEGNRGWPILASVFCCYWYPHPDGWPLQSCSKGKGY